jgi:protein SCO1/2
MTARALLLLLSAGLTVALGGLAPAAQAQRPSAQVEYVPPNELPAGVEVRERLGATVDLDAPMIDQVGQPRTLRSLLVGDRPLLLTFNYSSCPGLCSVHLNRLVEALAAGKLVPGATYRLVTIVLAPEETAARTARTRQQYLDKLAKLGVEPAAADGWTFLLARPGDGARSVKAIADSVGFGYRKVQGEYAHPAAVVALATDGTVTRYVHGIELVSGDLATTIVKAGLAEPSTAAGYVLACFHLAPSSPNALVARQVMRLAALAFVAALLGIGAFVLYARRHRSSPTRPSGVMPS